MNYSVLMTVYKNDSPEYFTQSVYSMLHQTVETNDFVLVCDGELTEELEQAIHDSFRGKEKILNLIRLPQNVGLGKALQSALPLCKNEWVARMDDDDIAYLDRCEKELAYLKTHPEVAILGTYVTEFDEDPSKPIRVKTVPATHKDILLFSRRRNPFNHPTVMINRDKILDIGNYSTMRTNQDVETWVRALNHGLIGANLKESLVYFRFDKSTYKRRKDWKNVKLLIDIWGDFWKNGYCSFVDYICVISIQIAVLIMPSKLVEWGYKYFR